MLLREATLTLIRTPMIDPKNRYPTVVIDAHTVFGSGYSYYDSVFPSTWHLVVIYAAASIFGFLVSCWLLGDNTFAVGEVHMHHTRPVGVSV